MKASISLVRCSNMELKALQNNLVSLRRKSLAVQLDGYLEFH